MTDHRENELQGDLHATARSAQAWMLQQSFPFWAERTPDPAGGFYERLDTAGEPIAGENSRVRLQARMGFTFALAASLGWDRARANELAARACHVLTRDCRRPDGLYGRIVKPGEGLIDDTPETYDNAFALLCFATVTQVFDSADARAAGDALTQAIDTLLAHPDGGYAERLPRPSVREQNPHMHLTEASLAWYEATGDVTARDRAERIARFVADHFFRDDIGLLVEEAGGDDAANRVEAGHMFEWVWILGRLQSAGGAVPCGLAQKLHDGGMRLLGGLDYLPLSQELDGRVREPVQRTWGPTEKLKGHIALWQLEGRGAPSPAVLSRIVRTQQDMMRDHVEPALPGAWIDVLGPDKRARARDITPATGYHLFLALKEYIAFAQANGGQRLAE